MWYIYGRNAEDQSEVTCTVVRWLHKIFNMMWETGKAPEDWQKAMIVAIHKTGSEKLCKNYSRISLLSIQAKFFQRFRMPEYAR